MKILIMAHPGWLPNKVITLELPQRGRFLTRVLGLQDRTLVLLAPAEGNRTIWPSIDSPANIISQWNGEEIISPGTFTARTLKPLPLLSLSLEGDIPFIVAAEERAKKIIAISSGKGGTGKTFVSVNLAWELASSGYRVLLVDLDLGTANISTSLGIRPESDISQVVDGIKTLTEIEYILSENLSIIPGISKNKDYANLSPWQFQRLINGFNDLENQWDYIIIDTAAGLSPNTTNFLYCADFIAMVINDTPTSVVDGYGLIKAVASQFWPPEIGLIVNRAFHPAEAKECADRFIQTSKDFLSVPVSFLGSIREDTAVIASLRSSRPALAMYPHANSSEDFKKAVQKLLAQLKEPSQKYGRALP